MAAKTTTSMWTQLATGPAANEKAASLTEYQDMVFAVGGLGLAQILIHNLFARGGANAGGGVGGQPQKQKITIKPTNAAGATTFAVHTSNDSVTATGIEGGQARIYIEAVHSHDQ